MTQPEYLRTALSYGSIRRPDATEKLANTVADIIGSVNLVVICCIDLCIMSIPS